MQTLNARLYRITLRDKNDHQTVGRIVVCAINRQTARDVAASWADQSAYFGTKVRDSDIRPTNTVTADDVLVMEGR